MTVIDRTTAMKPSKASPKKLTPSTIIRLAGVSALIGGLCYVGVGVLHPANIPASVTTTRWEIAHLLACAMSLFGLLGLTGIYARQAAKAGVLGLIGYVMLSFWMVLVMGFSFVEAFVLPHLATVTPAFADSWMKVFNGGTSAIDMGSLPALWTTTAPLYMIGGLTFGIATYRARILPRGAAVLLALGTALAPLASQLSLSAQPKTAIPVGLALAWLGCALMTEQRAPATVHSDAVKATA